MNCHISYYLSNANSDLGVAILPTVLVTRLYGPLALSCKTWILPFGEVQQYVHPGDEGKNFCLLCLIDVSIIAICVFGGGGGSYSQKPTISS